jgi:prepilin-type N-terminal cleavage/methylation domain-containing protein
MTRRRPDAVGRGSPRDGFTMIEVLAAFAVLAVLTLVIGRSLVVARTGSVVVNEYAEAEAVARTLLEGPVPLSLRQPGQLSGTLEGHAFLMVTQPIDIPIRKREKGEPPMAPPTHMPLRLTISVAADGGRMVKVQTVRLVPKETSQ